jgi:predicted RNA-binding Zn-ribbon protein involved in translation (DUF1610 family)
MDEGNVEHAITRQCVDSSRSRLNHLFVMPVQSMADNRAATVRLICPSCGQAYMAISGQVRQCIACKVDLVPVEKQESPK